LIEIVEVDERYRVWAQELLAVEWAGPVVVTCGRLHDAGRLPGLVAIYEGQPAGLATYLIEDNSCELVTLNSLKPGFGIGSALLTEVKELAAAAGCARLWLITTNDNTAGLRFFQKQGFVLVALHREALTESRRLKPQIPLVGRDGIPLRDELELVYFLISSVNKKAGL
jgi:GNAT superfamily N-acetyltransferase